MFTSLFVLQESCYTLTSSSSSASLPRWAFPLFTSAYCIRFVYIVYCSCSLTAARDRPHWSISLAASPYPTHTYPYPVINNSFLFVAPVCYFAIRLSSPNVSANGHTCTIFFIFIHFPNNLRCIFFAIALFLLTHSLASLHRLPFLRINWKSWWNGITNCRHSRSNRTAMLDVDEKENE